jgi:hypothetical protein
MELACSFLYDVETKRIWEKAEIKEWGYDLGYSKNMCCLTVGICSEKNVR